MKRQQAAERRRKRRSKYKYNTADNQEEKHCKDKNFTVLFCVIGNSLEFPITQKGTNVPMMRTRAKQKHAA